ncbi:MAG: hypothetical protein Q7U44_09890, partial [Desulfuromonadales bacterium]|nr:hypothetical protein [Desulfuromonadales bacterium]
VVIEGVVMRDVSEPLLPDMVEVELRLRSGELIVIVADAAVFEKVEGNSIFKRGITVGDVLRKRRERTGTK